MSAIAVPPPFVPPQRLLLGPGPSDASPRVLRAMSAGILGHLDPAFLRLMGETQGMLRHVFGTHNRMTLPISATGMAGMEALLGNLVEPGDKVLVCPAGYFGGRMVEVARRLQGDLVVLDGAWGEVFDLDRVRDAIRQHRPKVVGMVHAETSTGCLQPIGDLGPFCHEHGALLVLDCVTSLGCVPVELDRWEVDAAFSCSQKGLSCPPGLAPVTFSERAMEKIRARKTQPFSWYFDIGLIDTYWGGDRAYHHTAPIAMNYALHEGLREVLEEGLEARYARHRRNYAALRAGLEKLGLRYVAPTEHQLPQLNAVHIPDGIEDMSVRKPLLEEFGIEIGGGLGAFKGKVWRIGVMGQNSRAGNVLLLLSALEQLFGRLGRPFEPGSAVAAANAAFNQSA